MVKLKKGSTTQQPEFLSEIPIFQFYYLQIQKSVCQYFMYLNLSENVNPFSSNNITFKETNF